MFNKEHYRPQPMGVNGTYQTRGTHIAGFLGVTAGTITITDADGTILLAGMPIGTGPNGIAILTNTGMGALVQLGGGASGSLLL